jgi:hypothetical protein
MGIIYRVPGHGYFPSIRAGSEPDPYPGPAENLNRTLEEIDGEP